MEFAKKENDSYWRTYALVLAHFANGDRAEADAALKKLIDENADDAGSQIAVVYALRKEPDKVFEWLEHGWATHDAGVTPIFCAKAMKRGSSFLRVNGRLPAADRSRAGCVAPRSYTASPRCG